MKKFLRRFLLYFLAFTLGCYLLDILISANHKKTSSPPAEFEVWNDIYDGKINTEIAIYGSSRAWVHFDCEIIQKMTAKKCYNFGIDGHNFNLQYLRHKEYLKHNKKPKYIVLAMDLFSFESEEELYQQDQLLPFMLFNSDIRKHTKEYNEFSFYDFYFPLVRYYGRKNAIDESIDNFKRKSKPKSFRKNGYKGMYLKWVLKKGIKRFKIPISEARLEQFQEFILECKNKNIHLILVMPPQHIIGQNYVINRRKIINRFEQIANKNNLNFLDYSSDPICLDSNLFYNTSHLNIYGAQRFSKNFAIDFQDIIHAKKN